jgi:ankyrin repeat protein
MDLVACGQVVESIVAHEASGAISDAVFKKVFAEEADRLAFGSVLAEAVRVECMPALDLLLDSECAKAAGWRSLKKALCRAMGMEDVEPSRKLLALCAADRMPVEGWRDALAWAAKSNDAVFGVALDLAISSKVDMFEACSHALGVETPCPERMRRMVQAGGNPSSVGEHRCSPILAAASSGRDGLEWFAELAGFGADIAAVDGEGRSVLSLAVESRSLAMVELVLASGGFLDAKRAGSALAAAAGGRNYGIGTEDLEIAKRLIEAGACLEGGAEMDTPLMLAVYMDNEPMARLLIAAGARLDAEADGSGGQDILGCAMENCGQEMSLMLLEEGVDWRRKKIVDDELVTLRRYASDNGWDRVEGWIAANKESKAIRRILSKKAKPKAGPASKKRL